MSGKTSRRKGHDKERAFARKLTQAGIPAQRVLEYQEGAGYDVEELESAFVYQCKKGKKINVKAAYKEMADVHEAKIKAVVADWDRDLSLVCVSEDDWITIREWLKDVIG